MASHLPFDALRAFVDVARGRSLAEAAERLAITSGAVSQRLAVLSDWHGVPLVEKRGRRLVPTEAGWRLYRRTEAAVVEIEAALAPQTVDRILHLHVTAAFYETWLVPRLARLSARLSPWTLQVETSAEAFDRKRGWTALDAAIRYAPRANPELSILPLIRPDLCLVTSKVGPVGELVDVLRTCPLLRQRSHDDWHIWLSQTGLSGAEVTWGTRFENDADALRAAAAGLGIASVRSCNLTDRTDHHLVARCPDPLDRAYCLLIRRTDTHKPVFRAVTDWMADELRE